MKKRRRHSHIPQTHRHISELLDVFLDGIRQRRYSPRTVELNRGNITDFILFLAAARVDRIQDVGAQHIEQYQKSLIERELADATRDSYLRAVRRFFRHLESRQLIFLDPTAGLVLSKPREKLPVVPTVDDVKKLLAVPDAANEPLAVRDRAFMETAYCSAARLGELHKLAVTDVDLQEKTLHVHGKGSKDRVLPLGRQAVYWLKRYLRDVRPKLLKDQLDEHALWISVRGRGAGYILLETLVPQYSKKAGIEPTLSCHSLRRACATHMLQNGAHPVAVQFLLGHASLKTLSSYLRITITDIKQMHKHSKPGK